MKVGELEAALKDQFGLTVQVFRHSGNIWLETVLTDKWTLQQQNEHGKELCTKLVRQDSPEDFDLNRGNI